DLVAVLEDDAAGAAALDVDSGDGRAGEDLGAQRLGSMRDGIRQAAGAALRDAPGAECAVDLAHVVVQQHVGGTRRVHALERADDPRCRHGRLERIGLEPLVEEVGRAHRHELDEDRLLAFGQILEGSGEAGQRPQRPRVEARQVRRDDRQDRLDEPSHVDHELAVFLVGLGIRSRPAAKLTDGSAVVVDAPEIVAATLWRTLPRAKRRERAVERQDVEAVLRELELADDPRPQQRDDVAEDRKPKPREDLLGDRRAAHEVAAFEDEGLQPGTGEVRGADEAVVAAADDDRVVAPGQASPSSAGCGPRLPRRDCSAPDLPLGAASCILRGHEHRDPVPSAHRAAQPQDAVARVERLLRVERLRRLPRHRIQRHPRGGGAHRRLAALQIPGPRPRRAAPRRPRHHPRREEAGGGSGVLHAMVRRVDIDGSRTGYTGDLGYELWIPTEHALKAWDRLIEAGRPFGLRPAGMLALDVVRLEAGLILIEVDYTSARHAMNPEQNYSPYEIGLGRLVSFGKADFVGRLALEREQRAGGPARRLVGLELDWYAIEGLYAA